MDTSPDFMRNHEKPSGHAQEAKRESLLHSQLIVMHSWGGGAEKWTRDYVLNDNSRYNYVLKSHGYSPKFGRIVELYDSQYSSPIRSWIFRSPIAATVSRHKEYESILDHVIGRYNISAIIIASLIGHSLDTLRTGLPTALLFHDYYPICPAFNITYNGICSNCDDVRLARCYDSNPWAYFRDECSAADLVDLRKEFTNTIQKTSPLLLAPSESVFRNIANLSPAILEKSVRTVIPHGIALDGENVGPWPLKLGERMRVVIPGILTPQKGEDILEVLVDELLNFADLYFVGGGRTSGFVGKKGVHILGAYKNQHLPGIMRRIKPQICLLPSMVPETYGYALSEFSRMAVPCLVSKVGAYEERIQDGENGFLAESTSASMLAKLKKLAANPASLERVGNNLKRKENITDVSEMIAMYHKALSPRKPSSVLDDNKSSDMLDIRELHFLGLVMYWFKFYLHRGKRWLKRWVRSSAVAG